MPQAPPKFNTGSITNAFCLALYASRPCFSMTLALCGPAAAEVIAPQKLFLFRYQRQNRRRARCGTEPRVDRRQAARQRRHPGATKIRFGGKATYVQSNGRCHIAQRRKSPFTPRSSCRAGATARAQASSCRWSGIRSQATSSATRSVTRKSPARRHASWNKAILALPAAAHLRGHSGAGLGRIEPRNTRARQAAGAIRPCRGVNFREPDDASAQ